MGIENFPHNRNFLLDNTHLQSIADNTFTEILQKSRLIRYRTSDIVFIVKPHPERSGCWKIDIEVAVGATDVDLFAKRDTQNLQEIVDYLKREKKIEAEERYNAEYQARYDLCIEESYGICNTSTIKKAKQQISANQTFLENYQHFLWGEISILEIRRIIRNLSEVIFKIEPSAQTVAENIPYF